MYNIIKFIFLVENKKGSFTSGESRMVTVGSMFSAV